MAALGEPSLSRLGYEQPARNWERWILQDRTGETGVSHNITGQYTAQLGPGEFIAYLSYRYTDEYWVEASNDPRGLVADRSVWDLNLSYDWQWDEGRNVRFTVFGRDLTDEYDYNSSVIIPATIAFGAVAGGQEYGLQISGNF